MHILIAPNAFKGSLDANEASIAIEEGLMQSNLKCICECFPIGDGGDGTGNLIIQKCKGIVIDAVVQDPLRRHISSTFGLIDKGQTAVIEMASASGIRLLGSHELDPLHATTYGTGEMIKLALDEGVNRIIIGMGGSATIDGGLGILNALGIRFLNAKNEPLSSISDFLCDQVTVDVTGLDQRISGCKINVLCDVDNRLLGKQGAAAVFGPQKGASQEQIHLLETSLTNFKDITLRQTGKNMDVIPYGGAAGGAAAGIWAYLNAEIVNGADYFLQLTSFDEALQKADLLITGEGKIDDQTLQGKGPFAVASRAKALSIPVIGMAGKVPLDESLEIFNYFDILLAIGNEPVDISIALTQTTNNLVRTSKSVGNFLSMNMG